jgi:DNA-binding helix-hairpin-helix protein with protein kinase domain
MFGISVTVVRTPNFDLIAIWAQIEAVNPDESGTPVYANAYKDQFTPDPRIDEARRERRKKRLIGLGVMLLAVLIIAPGKLPVLPSIFILVAGIAALRRFWTQQSGLAATFEKNHKDALRSFEAAATRWSNMPKVPKDFLEIKQRLEAQKQEFQKLGTLRAQRVAELQAALERRQMTRWLEKHRIEDATIPNIKQERKNLLRAYGIEDASDIHYNMAIKGFGPTLRAALWQWRQSIEARFVFNPHEGFSPADLRAVEAEIAQKRATLIQALSAGPQALKQVLIPWQVERATALSNLNHWSRIVAQTEVNLESLGRF